MFGEDGVVAEISPSQFAPVTPFPAGFDSSSKWNITPWVKTVVSTEVGRWEFRYARVEFQVPAGTVMVLVWLFVMYVMSFWSRSTVNPLASAVPELNWYSPLGVFAVSWCIVKISGVLLGTVKPRDSKEVPDSNAKSTSLIVTVVDASFPANPLTRDAVNVEDCDAEPESVQAHLNITDSPDFNEGWDEGVGEESQDTDAEPDVLNVSGVTFSKVTSFGRSFVTVINNVVEKPLATFSGAACKLMEIAWSGTELNEYVAVFPLSVTREISYAWVSNAYNERVWPIPPTEPEGDTFWSSSNFDGVHVVSVVFSIHNFVSLIGSWPLFCTVKSNLSLVIVASEITNDSEFLASSMLSLMITAWEKSSITSML